jgi:hypothetical protein
VTDTRIKPLYAAVCNNCGENIYRETEPKDRERIGCESCGERFQALELEFGYCGNRWVAECPECDGLMVIPGTQDLVIAALDVECGECFSFYPAGMLTFEFIGEDE